MVNAKAYYKERKLIYCKINGKHYALERHWEIYLKFRKETPGEVELFMNIKMLRHKLFNQLGVLI